MKDYSNIIFLSIPLFAGIEFMAACGSCETTDTTSTAPVPTVTINAAPAPPPVPVPPPAPLEPSWKRVGDLDRLVGRWGEEPKPWAVVMAQGPDCALYPWCVSFGDGQTKPYDCGFFERPNEPEGWRVAFCKGGAIGSKRRAEKIVIETLHPAVGAVKLRIQLLGSYELRVDGAPDEFLSQPRY